MKLQDKNAHVFAFSGPITSRTWQQFVNGFSNAISQGCASAHLIISSVGGEAEPAKAIYGYLLALPFHLTTYNQDNIQSAGVTIFLAGKRRIACPTARFMLHPVMAFPGAESSSRATLTELERIERHETELILEILRARQVHLSDSQIERFKLHELPLSAQEALACHLIDEIGDTSYSGSSPFHLLSVPM